jgi:hypothetical protein
VKIGAPATAAARVTTKDEARRNHPSRELLRQPQEHDAPKGEGKEQAPHPQRKPRAQDKAHRHDEEADGHHGFGGPHRQPPPYAVRVAGLEEAERLQPRPHGAGKSGSDALGKGRRLRHHQLHHGGRKGKTDQRRKEGAEEECSGTHGAGKPVCVGDDPQVPVLPGRRHGPEKSDPQGEVTEVVGGVGDAETRPAAAEELDHRNDGHEKERDGEDGVLDTPQPPGRPARPRVSLSRGVFSLAHGDRERRYSRRVSSTLS